MKKSRFSSLFVVFIFLGSCAVASAEETKKEKLEAKSNQVMDEVKEGIRDAQDKGCEMIDGKMKCFGKKVKHKAKTMSDKTKSKVKELKNKVD